jgi:hypothetical protein
MGSESLMVLPALGASLMLCFSEVFFAAGKSLSGQK